MGHTLHVITRDVGGELFCVGAPERDYLECLRHGQRITAAMHRGDLPGVAAITIVRGGPRGPLYGGLLPGDVFRGEVHAVAACAAHVGVRRPVGDADAELWFPLAAQALMRSGVLVDDEDGGLRLLRMPRRDDLPLLVVDEGAEVFRKISGNH